MMKQIVAHCIVFFFATLSVFAQSNVAPAAAVTAPAVTAPAAVAASDAPEKKSAVNFLLSPTEILEKGGWPMLLLGVISLIGIALILYFFLVLRMRNITPPRFLSDIESMISSGRMNDARKACLRNKSPAAAVTLAAIDYVEREPNPDAHILIENIESEGSRQATAITNNLRYLADIAHIAPMIGLLGTVLGMFTAFSGMGMGDVQATPEILAKGVGKALMTTAAGLIVGIPALIFYSYFRNKAHRLLANLEIVGTDLLNLLTSSHRKR